MFATDKNANCSSPCRRTLKTFPALLFPFGYIHFVFSLLHFGVAVRRGNKTWAYFIGPQTNEMLNHLLKGNLFFFFLPELRLSLVRSNCLAWRMRRDESTSSFSRACTVESLMTSSLHGSARKSAFDPDMVCTNSYIPKGHPLLFRLFLLSPPQILCVKEARCRQHRRSLSLCLVNPTRHAG